MYFQRNFRLLIYGPQINDIQSKSVEQAEWTDIPMLFQYMVEAMRKSGRTGISAPQIGLFKQFIVVERKDHSVIGLVNPEVTRLYGEETDGEESCSSIPPCGNLCRVPRLSAVDVEASLVSDPEVRTNLTFRDEVARIVQHEIDHLNGISFIDRATKGQRSKVINSFNNWKAMRKAQTRMREENGNVNTGVVTAHSGQSLMS